MLPLAAATLFSGCQTARVLPPPSAEFRERLGKIAVVALTNAPQIRLQTPDSRADILAEKDTNELVTPRTVGRKLGGSTGGPEALVVGSVALATPILVMGGAPLWQELRRGYGLVVADNASAVARASAVLKHAVSGLSFDQQLAERVRQALTDRAPAASTSSAAHDADTVLELMVYEPNLSGSESINPGLQLSLGLRVRLLDRHTRGQLYYDYLDYRGPRHTFVRWAADDARLFREELDRCLAHLSSEIAAQLFTRAPTEIPSRTALASLGLERRPPSPAAPAGGPFWSPRSSRGLYARN